MTTSKQIVLFWLKSFPNHSHLFFDVIALRTWEDSQANHDHTEKRPFGKRQPKGVRYQGPETEQLLVLIYNIKSSIHPMLFKTYLVLDPEQQVK